MKILLVEDDQSISELLATTLTAHRYTVDVASDGQAGLELARLWNYDLILLDVQLPKLDGISVCRQIRFQGAKTPILILTARGSNDDIVAGLDAGADDYVTKPCEPTQLLARIRALLRRGGGSIAAPVLTWGALCLDPASARVTYQHQDIALRLQEYNLLELFLRHPHRVFSRSAILDLLWTAEDFPTENAVTNLIKDLRRKLKSAGMVEDLIETIYGLGYRLKAEPVEPVPDSPIEAVPEQREAGETAETRALSLINQLAERFQSSLSQRMKSLEEAAQLLQAGQLSLEQQREIQAEAHRLTGSLGMYGYARGSELARSIEHLLLEDTILTKSQGVHFSQLLAELKQEISKPAIVPDSASPQPASEPFVLVMGEDVAFAEALQQEAPTWGLRVASVPNWAMAERQLLEFTPAAILLDLQGDAADENGLVLLRAVKEQFPNIPVLTLAEQDSLVNRIAASRLGSERYMPKPVTPTQVLEAIYCFATRYPNTLEPPAPQARVMAVDDDRELLAALTHLLQPWGLQVTCLSDANQFWNVLTQTDPDLLLLDLEMPTFNGIDLCRVVRQDAKYGDLPILVVTAHTEVGFIQQAFEAGADDLIRKPVVGAELVTRVLSRIERSRLRQQLDHLRRQQSQTFQYQSRVDSLTQIANRRQFDEFLVREWQRHLQEQAPLSLLLCDVDFFKRYNDHYGHLAGDTCLKQLASTIQGCIHPTKDLVARYGGEEFGIILPRTDLKGALRVADRIQQAIAQRQIPYPDSPINPFVTLSLGITGRVPTLEHPLEHLLSSADQALYAAKERGRNTYCLYG